MKTKQTILTQLLPKTGQVISYQSGDDGDYEAGWWRGKKNADNKTRFISLTLAGKDFVYDRATDLLWPAVGNDEGGMGAMQDDWEAVIAYAEGLTFAGYSDWRLPNVKEWGSLIDYGHTSPALDTDFFSSMANDYYWTSTTTPNNTLNAFRISLVNGAIASGVKSTNKYVLLCRGGL